MTSTIPRRALAGPVASQDWFTDNLKAAVKVIPQDKLISRHRQLRLRLGAEAEARTAAAGRERHQRHRAGSLAGRARFGSGRGFRRRQSQSPHQLPGRTRTAARHLVPRRGHRAEPDARRAVPGHSDFRAVAAGIRRSLAVAGLGHSGRSRRGEQTERCSARPGCGHGGQRRDPAHRGPARPTDSAASPWIEPQG